MSINRANYRLWAKKHGYGINEELAEMTFDGLDMKKKQFGIAYCPCVAPFAHGTDTICPCLNARLFKECHCGLFKWE